MKNYRVVYYAQYSNKKYRYFDSLRSAREFERTLPYEINSYIERFTGRKMLTGTVSKGNYSTKNEWVSVV